MNAYHPTTVFSSIDHGGRYSYGNQPAIAQWNLTRLAEAMLPLFDADQEQAIAIATEALGQYPAFFQQHWLSGMRAKLGLTIPQVDDLDLIQSLLNWMQTTKADFTNTFRSLSSADPATTDQPLDTQFQAWHARWRQRLSQEDRSIAETQAAMNRVNPAVIPRNHRVEEALAAAEDQSDLSLVHRLLEVLATPYDVTPQTEPYQLPPADESQYRTFCGT
jgi:uncharacterized protein YdiU (UPF0061 family)